MPRLIGQLLKYLIKNLRVVDQSDVAYNASVWLFLLKSPIVAEGLRPTVLLY
jgi:hypothetical protein